MRLLLSSPLGPLLAEYGPDEVRALRFWREGAHPPSDTRDAPARGDLLGVEIERQLRKYFAGERREFNLPLAAAGTPFQLQVREALRRIPFGETRSYGQVAESMGNPGATRAIGQANARNPLPIIVPCHRVVASGGRIGGYMGAGGDGSGADLKRWLLRHESAGSAIMELL